MAEVTMQQIHRHQVFAPLGANEVVHAFMPCPDPVALLSPHGTPLLSNTAWSNRFKGCTVLPESVGALPSVEGNHTVTLRCADGGTLALPVWSVRMPDHVLLIALGAAHAEYRALAEQLRRRVLELERLSATDHLTGVWNRRHLDRTVEVELARSNEAGSPVSLILLDIDHFKRLNDRFGHRTGDWVLLELVDLLQQRLRAADNLFRWGGEEFAVLAATTGYRGAERLAEQLRRTVADHRFPEVGAVTVSIGVAEHASGEDAGAWFARLDRALYRAKDDGRNRVVVDRQGCSDSWNTSGMSVLRLKWQEAYECGEPTIDAQHRELFALANALIDTMTKDAHAGAVLTSLDTLLAHVQQHFSDEEAMLVRLQYGALDAHKLSHAGLLKRALHLREQAGAGGASLGAVVEFLAQDVIARHLMISDRGFFPLFEGDAVRC